ncbi:MAG: hypothetical protein ABI237_06725 [Ginsengibacter sp.]
MIIVKPNGGLGNRMRVINSAICLANKNNHTTIRVLWKKDWGLNASFTDIFEPVNEISLIENKFLMAYYFYSRKSLPLGYKYYDDEAILNKRFDENYWDSDHNKVIVNACYDFYYPSIENNFFGMFKPVNKLLEKIDLITQNFSDDCVGVHIRRADHQIAKEKSTIEDFISRMDTILKESPDSKFYLSTDDPVTELQIAERYGNKIFSLKDRNLHRNDLIGIEDAVIDLFCLSRTKLILGSYLSSFSEVASAIGKIPLETILKNKPTV